MPPPVATPLLILLNSAWNAVNFRAGLIRALIASGYAVTVAAPSDGSETRVTALGARFVTLPMAPHGRSPLGEAALLARIVRLLRAERPAAILSYTAKPNIYGGIAAAMLGIPIVNNIAGLGSFFGEADLTSRILRRLYRLALLRSARVFFQNHEDLDSFVDQGIVAAGRAALLPGSGVDLTRFAPAPPHPHARPITFLMAARLLREKGVETFVEAARLAAGPNRRFVLAGFVDKSNPRSVTHAEVAAWAAAGTISYLGAREDVREVLREADCFVLPSYYREGTPRALLEAAASGLPLITTDMPGCRDVVDPDANGWIVPPRDAAALASAMEAFAALDPAPRAAMGAASRRLAEQRFDERLVIDAYLAALAEHIPGHTADVAPSRRGE